MTDWGLPKENLEERAFPCERLVGYGAYERIERTLGMTLRDWFAGQALASGLWRSSTDCYKAADAMMKCREKRSGQEEAGEAL